MNSLDIKKIREIHGFTQEDLVDKMGMSLRTIQNWESGTKIPKSKHAILRLLLDDVPKSEKEAFQVNEEGSGYSKLGIPLIPIEAMAGIGRGEMIIDEIDCERYVVPVFRQADFLIRVTGNSMAPKYSAGDIVACRIVPMTDIFFQWNRVYVLDTDQGALIKRVKKLQTDDRLLLVSENISYEPLEISLEKVNAIAIVVGIIRLD